MVAPRAAVKFTANFESNLAAIQAFWLERDAPQVLENLLDDLGNSVIRNLEQHPRIGRRFFDRSPQSVEVKQRVADLQKRLGAAEVREYLSGDYLLLYSVGTDEARARAPVAVHLLAIRHHRQLSFDFERFWSASRPEQC